LNRVDTHKWMSILHKPCLSTGIAHCLSLTVKTSKQRLAERSNGPNNTRRPEFPASGLRKRCKKPQNRAMRLWIILHLCITCSLLSWHFCAPFAARHLHTKVEQALICEADLELEPQADLGSVKPELSFPLSLWIGLSFLLCIPLLLEVGGIAAAAWLLPLLILLHPLYCERAIPPEPLLPTEEVLLVDVLGESKAPSLSGQRDQLRRGLELYLGQKWGDAKAFARERLKRHRERGVARPRLHPAFWFFLLVWNLFFAFFVSRLARRLERGRWPQPIREESVEGQLERSR